MCDYVHLNPVEGGEEKARGILATEMKLLRWAEADLRLSRKGDRRKVEDRLAVANRDDDDTQNG